MPSASQQRIRGIYGTHYWVPETQTDWSAGIYRDVARVDIPRGGVYDSRNFLFDRPGLAYKRGGSSYATAAGTLLGNTAKATRLYAVAHGNFPLGTQTNTKILIGVALGNLATIDNAGGELIVKTGSNTFVSSGPVPIPREKIPVFVGGSKNLMVFTDCFGLITPYVWSGSVTEISAGSATSKAPAAIGATTARVLTVTGTPTGGSLNLVVFKSVYGGGNSGEAIVAINYNSTAAQAKTALDAAGVGTFTTSGGPLPGSAITITIPTTAVGVFVSDYLSLTGGTNPTAAIAITSAATNCPKAKLSCIHLSRIVLANTNANPNRIFFSPVPDPEAAWDSTAYVDANDEVTGIASIGTSTLIVFTENSVEKYVGDVPPPGTNFTHSVVSTGAGCTDARSITPYAGGVIYANPSGIYSTNGVGDPISLTEGKIGSYWRSLFTSYYTWSPLDWSITTGLYGRRYLFVTVCNNVVVGAALVASLLYDFHTGAWIRIDTNKFSMYATGIGGESSEIYAANEATVTGGQRIEALSGYFSPSSSNKNDADGTAVTCLLEGRPFGGGPGVLAFGKGHVSYDMRDAASDNPTLAVAIAPGTEAPTFTNVAESPLVETTDLVRKRYTASGQSAAQSVRFTQSNASSKTEIYSIEQDIRAFPRGSGGQ